MLNLCLAFCLSNIVLAWTLPVSNTTRTSESFPIAERRFKINIAIGVMLARKAWPGHELYLSNIEAFPRVKPQPFPYVPEDIWLRFTLYPDVDVVIRNQMEDWGRWGDPYQIRTGIYQPPTFDLDSLRVGLHF